MVHIVRVRNVGWVGCAARVGGGVGGMLGLVALLVSRLGVTKTVFRRKTTL